MTDKYIADAENKPVINTDWYRDTLAADVDEMGMPETAKDICLMADTIDTLQETIDSLVEQNTQLIAENTQQMEQLAHMEAEDNAKT